MITIDQKLAEYLNDWNVNGWPVGNLILCLIALVLCVLLVGLIGIERELRGRSAGLRTHLLVGVSSTILMIISIYGFPALFGEKRDVARLAAQIITGVGFLGAGAIIHRNSGIKGLTTAGTIWASMAIGMACGSFNFILAGLGTLLIVLVITAFKRFEMWLNKKTPSLILTAPKSEAVLSKILEISKRYGCSVHGVSSSLTDDKEHIEVVYQAEFAHSNEQVMMDYLRCLETEIEGAVVLPLTH